MKNNLQLLRLFCLFMFVNLQFIQGFDRSGTHIPALITAVLNTNGPILEMGCGDNSTPLLHVLCTSNQRYLLSAETNLSFMKTFDYLHRPWHQFQYVTDWATVGNNNHWSVILIDHAPELRMKVDIQRLRHQTDIFVVHDTEAAVYQYENVLSTFKYRYDYKIYNPYTTLVSDTIDVASLFQ